MPVNILYLHNQSDISGGERSLLALWQNLDRDRFCPFVILPNDGPLAKKVRELKIDMAFFSFPRVHPLNMRECFKAQKMLSGFIRTNAIRLIHSYGPRNNIIASWAAKSLKIPVIWHERNIPEIDEVDITRRLFFVPDAVICNSHAVAKRFVNTKNQIPSKAKVIYNGIDLKQFTMSDYDQQLAKSLDLENRQVVGIVTNFSIRRRIEDFIDVAKIVYSQMPDVRFLIIGGEFSTGSYGRNDFIREKIEQLGLKDIIRMTGFQDDVPRYLSLCDVVCHVTRMDACSRSVLEAMACKKAVVAINDGGTPELIEDQRSGILITVSDKEGYANAVIKLLGDLNLRKTIAQSARERVEKLFSIFLNTKATEELYQQLLGRIDRLQNDKLDHRI